MLSFTSYMDETGHSEDPAIDYAGMAGFVALAGEWEIFKERWSDTLQKAGIKPPFVFHMKDFAHSVIDFAEWKGKEVERKALFGRLIQIIRETNAGPIGAIVSLKDFRSLTQQQQADFLDPYYLAFQTCTRGAALEALFLLPEEKVETVYAYQSEFGGRAEKLWQGIKETYDYGQRLGKYTSSTPEENAPLQAADVFAYELSKEFENRIRRPHDAMRWGLRQILTMVKVPPPRIILYDRKELLRRVKESNFADQTGVEELKANQMQSAMDQMKQWAEERGGVTWDFDI
jgi:hypothetical protein